jgi:hypothetical protein
MNSAGKAIESVLSAIDWRKIKGYHKKLGILWEFTDDKETTQRIPTVAELKDELRSILHHMHGEELSYISYGNWIIFWEQETSLVGDIRVIFRVADFHFASTQSNDTLDEELKRAIEQENYEYAAYLRDQKKDSTR